MNSRRLVFLSLASWSTWVLLAGCGNDGSGFRGAFTYKDTGGTGGAGAGAMSAGAGSGGLSGIGGNGTAAGAGGLAGGQAGTGGGTAGTTGDGGASGDESGGASGSSAIAGGGAGGMAGASLGGAASGGPATGGASLGGSSSGAGGAAGSTGVGGKSAAGSGGASGAGGVFGKAGFGGAMSGGSAGAAGSGGPLRTCAERCNADADCRVFGLDQGYRCNQGSHRCERFSEPCRSSIECLPGSSFWVFACNSDADCFFFSDDVCVDVGGVGRCARLAPSSNGCESPNPDEVTLPRRGASGSALVCANASRTCADGACVAGCTSNADCTPQRNGSVCDATTRLCRCTSDTDCGGPGVSHCNATSGRCECSDERDCAEVPNSNVCTSGRCGCSSVSACNAERTFSTTTYVCE